MSDNHQEIEIDASRKSLKIRGSDIPAILGIVVSVLTLYIVWQHTVEAKDVQVAFTTAVKELTASQKEMVQAQREQNCLIAIPQDSREKSTEFCKRITR